MYDDVYELPLKVTTEDDKFSKLPTWQENAECGSLTICRLGQHFVNL